MEGLYFFVLGIIVGVLGSVWCYKIQRKQFSTNATNTGPSPQRCKDGKVYKYENGVVKCVFTCPNFKGQA